MRFLLFLVLFFNVSACALSSAWEESCRWAPVDLEGHKIFAFKLGVFYGGGMFEPEGGSGYYRKKWAQQAESVLRKKGECLNGGSVALELGGDPKLDRVYFYIACTEPVPNLRALLPPSHVYELRYWKDCN